MDDVFADAANGEDGEAGEGFGLGCGRSEEGFGVGAEPDVGDAVAEEALVDSLGDGFDFRQLGHGWILEDEWPEREKRDPMWVGSSCA